LRAGRGYATMDAGMGLFAAAAVLGLIAKAVPRPVPAPAAPTCGVGEGAYLNGPRTRSDVALTFDLCPTSSHPGFSRCVLDTLVDGRIPATFFVTGTWASAHRRELRELAKVPYFDIGMHGLQHLALKTQPEAVIASQIDGDERRLRGLGIKPVQLFRPPYGSTREEVATVARRLGVKVVLWDVVSGDADPKLKSEAIDREVLRRVRGGSIVILHANHQGSATEEALPVIIRALRVKGFSFVTVRQLLAGCDGPGGT
jgi:peptidoglycan/xylan/chitin deacetylase (PgdA/CDA1 family)